jgi:hypothetical protein
MNIPNGRYISLNPALSNCYYSALVGLAGKLLIRDKP